MKQVVIIALGFIVVGCSTFIKVKDPDRKVIYDCDCSYDYAQNHPCYDAVLKYNNEQKRHMNRTRSRSGD